MAANPAGFRNMAVQNSMNLMKDFNEAYNNAFLVWSQAWTEMKRDIEFVLGKQWSAEEEAYLLKQGRAALHFNKMMRIVKLISGYQRKNRLSMKADPVEGSDVQTAEQLTAILLWLFNAGQMYSTMSEGFEAGSLMSGINLMHVGMDYGNDIVNGDPRIYRHPYNQFLLDPTFTERDLSDCDYAMIRMAPNKDQAKILLPFLDARDIDDIPLTGMDNKFPLMTAHRDTLSRPRMNLYYFWQRTTRPVWMILDKQTGAIKEVDGKTTQQVNQALEIAYAMHGPRFEKIRKVKPFVDLSIVLQNMVVYHGPDPSGIEQHFPLVPIMGTYVPEYDDWTYKIQALSRQLRDPQTEKNKRMSQMLDIIESQINSGYKAKSKAVIDKDALYRTGQGRVIWMADEAEMTDVEQLRGTDVPQSHFQLQEILDREIPSIANLNDEMFGEAANKDLEQAGVLAKIRQAAGLIGLQEYFDNYRFAKQTVGLRLIEAIQKNWTPDKVKRVTGQPPAQAFYTKDFGRYDCVATEGLLTDTQRQMFYAELKNMRAEGYAVPVSLLVEYMPIQLKDEIKKALVQAEQQQAQQAQRQMQLDEIAKQVMQSTQMLQIAQAREKLTQAEENRATAVLDRAKAAAEIQDIGAQRALELIRMLFEYQQAVELAGQRQAAAGGAA